MMAGFVLVYLEKFFKKICRKSSVDRCTILFPCSGGYYCPHRCRPHRLGNRRRNRQRSIHRTYIRFPFPVCGGIRTLYAPLVMTGLHHMTNAIDSQLLAIPPKTTILWPMIALSNIAQGSSVLAMSILQKKNEKAQQVNVPACISCYLGVTEPALFGVNLKYVFPLSAG